MNELRLARRSPVQPARAGGGVGDDQDVFALGSEDEDDISWEQGGMKGP